MDERAKLLEATVDHFVGRYIADDQDPSFDHFWWMKNEPIYPILQERMRVLRGQSAPSAEVSHVDSTKPA